MVILEAYSLQKEFDGNPPLFSDASFQIAQGDKIGLVGVNGAGKSTLFHLMTGAFTPDQGSIRRAALLRVGYMAQLQLDDTRALYDELLTVFDGLLDIERELADIASALEASPQPSRELIKRQEQLIEQFEHDGGYEFRSRARGMLRGLGFADSEFDDPVGRLSGGQRTRLELAKLLLRDFDLILLDEPTNHLDIEASQWLEEYLRSYRGAFVAVSHDRYFLDAVTSRTFELENGRLTCYDGGYSRYMAQKADDAFSLKRRHDNQLREIKRVEGIVEQQRRWGRAHNFVTAASKQKVVDRLKRDLVAPERAPVNIKFNFNLKPGGAGDVLVGEGLSKSFGGAPLFEGLRLHVRRGERVALIGPNGCGKTTLLRMLTGRDQNYKGAVRLGAGITIAYYDQTQAELDPSKTVLGEIWDAYPSMAETQVRGALAWFLFRGDDINKPVSVLSGGERARVALLKMVLRHTNFLVLDEPTNHLDIPSREMLERALEGYEGTILAVSHDRYFINRLINKVYGFEDGGLLVSEGGYDDYTRARECRRQQVAAQAETPTEQKHEAPALKSKPAARADARRLAAAVRAAESDIARAEQTVADLERDIESCGADYQLLIDLTARLENERALLEALYERWQKLADSH